MPRYLQFNESLKPSFRGETPKNLEIFQGFSPDPIS